MIVADVRDLVATWNLAEEVYCGKMPGKVEKSIGIYNSKHQYTGHVALGGAQYEGYGIKHITILLHWNRSNRDTESMTNTLFEKIREVRDAEVNGEKIKFIMPMYEPQDIGTDDDGICESVIEAAVVFEKKGMEEYVK